MKIRNPIICLLFFIIISQVAQAQVSHTTIEGSVYDRSSSRFIEFANVQLIQLPDSTVINTTVSEKKGRFSIEGVPPGNYILRCSFIGYEMSMTAPFSITSGTPKQNIGQVDLQISGKSLGEVVVTSKKQSLVTGIDRKTYNVDQDIMSRSGSASDILKNIPSVEVDIEGEVMLRGSADVMILINGKPSPLMGRSRAEILQQLPAHSIERIEVITNPSARFRPDGVSGIINIVLKKNIKNGFNGNALLNAGNNNRYSAGVNLNYRPKKLNLFANYNLRKDNRQRYNNLERVYIDTSTGLPETHFNQVASNANLPLGHMVSGGLDYTLDDRNSFGVSGTWYYRSQAKNDITNNYYYNAQKLLTEHFDRLRYDEEYEKEQNASAFFTHRFPGEEHELQLEFTTDNSKEVEDNRFTNRYHFPVIKNIYDNTLITAIDHDNQLTIDYTVPLPGDAKLEAGYDGLYEQEDLDFYGEYFDTVQTRFIKDHEKSNRFIFDQDIHAIYTTYERTWEKWGFSSGIRAEQVFTRSNLVTLDSTVKNNYFKIYPTLHLSYALKQGHELQLNYSKRVNRPDADDLNPFPEYQDPRHLRSGNPGLLPEVIHSVELGYKWQQKNFSFVPSFYYRYKVNGYTPVTTELNDSTLVTRRENLSSDQSAGLELIFSMKAGNWFNANLSSNIFYNRIETASEETIQNKSIFSMSANMNSSFNISKTTLLQVSTNYRSARLTAQGKTYPTIVMNMGMRQDLFGNKLSLSLTASDLFNSLRQKTIINTPDFSQTSINRRDGRVIFLGINFRFGIIKKEKEEKLQFDDTL